MHVRRWAPVVLGAILVGLLAWPALDPGVQLYYRDTGRCSYELKLFIAQQLRAGHAPFWHPWSESGTSVLAQVSPGLFHPLTALYLFLPFELAFKLNHLLVLPLSFIGADLLARRMGASPWAAAAGACAYAGSGYLVSLTASNLHYALGVATLPLALHALLRAADRFSPGRLLWAAYALALCFYGGEPQSMLICGVIGGLWLVGRDRSPRAVALVAAWGACALLLAAPAVLPALPRVTHSTRAKAIGADDLQSYGNAPARLAGTLLPFAFDDLQETSPPGGVPPYAEYFSSGAYEEAFGTSIVLGAPILLLALFAGRRRVWLLAGAAFLLLASTGDALGIQRLLFAAVPGMRLFRYPEKLAGPAALLLCLAGALGVDRALVNRRRFGCVAFTTAAGLLAAWLLLSPFGGALAGFMQHHGRTHSAGAAGLFVADLRRGLLIEGGLTAAVGAAGWVRAVGFAPLAGIACAAAAVAQSSGLLFTVPLEVFHAPVLLARELQARAGPSEGRWRINAQTSRVLVYRKADLRIARFIAAAQYLNPMLHQLEGIESAAEYTGLADSDYERALAGAPSAFAQVMGVRFEVKPPFAFGEADAARLGFARAAFGAWVKEFAERPRAFLAGCAQAASDRESALRALASPRFSPDVAVVPEDLGMPCPGRTPGVATLDRLAPGRMRARTDAESPQLLVVAEHFDEGWRATLDGGDAKVVRADLSALAVPVPGGRHVVELEYRPPHLGAGLALAGACAGALLALHFVRRRARRADRGPANEIPRS